VIDFSGCCLGGDDEVIATGGMAVETVCKVGLAEFEGSFAG